MGGCLIIKTNIGLPSASWATFGSIERSQAQSRDSPISSPPGLAGPAAHETSAILRPRRRHRGRYSLGANKPAYQLDPGFLEHLRLSPRAFIGPGARLLEFLFTGAPRRRRNPGGEHGTVASTMLRSRRSQRDGGGLPAPCS